MASWVWKYFKKIDSKTGICNICDPPCVVNRGGGTSAIERHLKSFHAMLNPRELSQAEKFGESLESSPGNSFGNFSSKKPQENKSTEWTNGHNMSIEIKEEPGDNDQSIIFEEADTAISRELSEFLRPVRAKRSRNSYTRNSSPLEVDSSLAIQETLFNIVSVKSVNKDNCFVCNEKLTSCRNKLSFILKSTGIPLFEILESFTGITVNDISREDSVVCHNCLVSFERFDELQRQANEIKNQLTQVYCQTHDELLYKEPENEDKDIENSTERICNKLPLTDADSPICGNSSYKERQKVYFCTKCDKRYIKASYEIHLVTDHESKEGPFECGRCSKFSQNNNLLKLHYVKHLVQDSKDMRKLKMSEEDSGDNKKYVCSVAGCKKRFVNSFKLSSHLKVHFNIKNYQCSICGKKFTENFELNAHIKNKHAAGATTKISKIANDLHRAPGTTEVTVSMHRGVFSRKKIQSGKRFVCYFSGCSKRFSTGFKLKSHIRVHNGEKPYECANCPRRFTENFELNAHKKKKHTGEIYLNEVLT